MAYGELEIERCVVAPPSNARHPAADTFRRLDEFSELASQLT
jgi:hypothetical protein